jgi:hypothetical protein
MSKYAPLRRHLEGRTEGEITLSFNQLDQLVDGLPASARNHRAWWANEAEGSHVQARAWINAGWRVDEVQLTAERVKFVRSGR